MTPVSIALWLAARSERLLVLALIAAFAATLVALGRILRAAGVLGERFDDRAHVAHGDTFVEEVLQPEVGPGLHAEAPGPQLR